MDPAIREYAYTLNSRKNSQSIKLVFFLCEKEQSTTDTLKYREADYFEVFSMLEKRIQRIFRWHFHISIIDISQQ